MKYVGWSSDDAVKHYLARVNAKIPHFETMEERELNFIKVFILSKAHELLLRNDLPMIYADDQCWGEHDRE